VTKLKSTDPDVEADADDPASGLSKEEACLALL
jgi:hypothetical protein